MHFVAHEGGWDEILLVAGPIVVLGLLLLLANRRADRVTADQDPIDEPGDNHV